jgi:predicted DNA-binding transcriptional regulator AlpA
MTELAGVKEISDELGVLRTTISMWATRRERSGFPQPVAFLAMGPVYDMAEVRAWHEQYVAKVQQQSAAAS